MIVPLSASSCSTFRTPALTHGRPRTSTQCLRATQTSSPAGYSRPCQSWMMIGTCLEATDLPIFPIRWIKRPLHPQSLCSVASKWSTPFPSHSWIPSLSTLLYRMIMVKSQLMGLWPRGAVFRWALSRTELGKNRSRRYSYRRMNSSRESPRSLSTYLRPKATDLSERKESCSTDWRDGIWQRRSWENSLILLSKSKRYRMNKCAWSRINPKPGYQILETIHSRLNPLETEGCGKVGNLI